MPFPFADKTFQFETLRALGYANNGGADVNEVLTLCKRIREGNLDDWVQEWGEAGRQNIQRGEQSDEVGDHESARQAYLRASNYLRTAEFFRRDNPDSDSIGQELYRLSLDAFYKAIKRTPWISLESFEVPLEGEAGVHLLAYIMIPNDGRGTHQRSTIVVTGGFDGTKEEAYMAFGAAALSRSFNFVCFEGPGQGQVIREQSVAFRPDWNTVVTPLVDELLKRKQDVHPDRLILVGWSMGGWLAAQTIAYEHRFCAAVLNDGVYDFASPWRDNVPNFIWWLIANGYAHLASTLVEVAVRRNTGHKWALRNALWTFKVQNAAEFLTKIVQYTLTDELTAKICTPLLVLDAESDHMLGGQPLKLFKSMKPRESVTHHQFKANQGAGEHCQMGAMAEQDRVIYKWILEHVLRKA